jgi:serine/threonine protein kinase/tetratricopeptide (TPR) repeat protein
MAHEARVQELLEASFASNRTPEELCGDSPELLSEVRQRWQQMRLVEAEIDALFPTPQLNGDDSAPNPRIPDDLPSILGYEIEAIVGHGGMGIVYKARHVRLNRPVAIKMLLGGAVVGTQERERFLREAEAIASVQHANIVQVHGAGDHEGRPYFTMEYVECGTLAQRLQGKPQPARDAAELVATLAAAVHFAHQHRIVHRDLKPANILLMEDGTPKIADFGLARHLDGGPSLTLNGTRMGTPSYMAPEQAMGNASDIGPATDIYSLGAIVYEMLTGRPPFHGETGVETVRQVIDDDPVPPRRLNSKVPPDLETICLKCLNKEPLRRYVTSGALAEDLRRFLRREPILARPTRILERISKWVCRYPAHSMLTAVSLLLLSALLGAGSWLAIQQAHRRDAVEADLREVRSVQKIARWDDARSALKRAEARLEGGGPHDLLKLLKQAERDLDFVMQLDDIRLKRVTGGLLAAYRVRANREYVNAFHGAGITAFRDDPSRVATLIKSSAVEGALLETIYDWIACASESAQRSWLLEIARDADSRLSTWPEGPRFLDPATWENRIALSKLTQSAPVATQSVALMLTLGEIVIAKGGDATIFLQQVQKEHPANFWANLTVGNAMCQWAPRDATGFYRAALASRPNAAVSYCAVGDAMRLQNNFDAATQYYRKGLQLDADNARIHNNLGLTLQAQGKPDEAIGFHTTAIQLDPEYAWAYYDLGNALRTEGRLEEARDHYAESVRLDPANRVVHGALRTLLLQFGRSKQALADWRRLIDTDPPDYSDWSGYPELCLFLEDRDEYRRSCRMLIERFSESTEVALLEQISRSCLLSPAGDNEIAQGTAIVDRVIAMEQTSPKWIRPYLWFAKGLAEYRQGRLESAATIMKGKAANIMGSAPRLVLAMTQHHLGDQAAGRQTLASAVNGFDWDVNQADGRDVWINHILHREAESLMMPQVTQFLQGKYDAADNNERLILAAACQFNGRWYAAARLYAEVVASEPKRAQEFIASCRTRAMSGKPIERIDEVANACRYAAARSAALAARGLGMDGVHLSETERVQMQRLVLEWLRADIDVWQGVLDLKSAAGRTLVRQQLTHWRFDPGLAGVREASELAKLPAKERQEFASLWEEVARLLALAN